jgi:hypothetical protein
MIKDGSYHCRLNSLVKVSNSCAALNQMTNYDDGKRRIKKYLICKTFLSGPCIWGWLVWIQRKSHFAPCMLHILYKMYLPILLVSELIFFFVTESGNVGPLLVEWIEETMLLICSQVLS